MIKIEEFLLVLSRELSIRSVSNPNAFDKNGKSVLDCAISGAVLNNDCAIFNLLKEHGALTSDQY